jgi:hypothetical protein
MDKLAQVVVEELNTDSLQEGEIKNVQQYQKKKMEAGIRMKLDQFAKELSEVKKLRERRWLKDPMRHVH